MGTQKVRTVALPTLFVPGSGTGERGNMVSPSTSRSDLSEEQRDPKKRMTGETSGPPSRALNEKERRQQIRARILDLRDLLPHFENYLNKGSAKPVKLVRDMTMAQTLDVTVSLVEQLLREPRFLSSSTEDTRGGLQGGEGPLLLTRGEIGSVSVPKYVSSRTVQFTIPGDIGGREDQPGPSALPGSSEQVERGTQKKQNKKKKASD